MNSGDGLWRESSCGISWLHLRLGHHADGLGWFEPRSLVLAESRPGLSSKPTTNSMTTSLTTSIETLRLALTASIQTLRLTNYDSRLTTHDLRNNSLSNKDHSKIQATQSPDSTINVRQA